MHPAELTGDQMRKRVVVSVGACSTTRMKAARPGIAYVGSYVTYHMAYGVLGALGFALLAVTVGTRLVRTAGA